MGFLSLTGFDEFRRAASVLRLFPKSRSAGRQDNRTAGAPANRLNCLILMIVLQNGFNQPHAKGGQAGDVIVENQGGLNQSGRTARRAERAEMGAT